MDEKFSQLRRARMEQYVSPDRAGPMAKVNSVMKTLEKEQERIKVYLERLFGDYSAEIEGDSTFADSRSLFTRGRTDCKL